MEKKFFHNFLIILIAFLATGIQTSTAHAKADFIKFDIVQNDASKSNVFNINGNFSTVFDYKYSDHKKGNTHTFESDTAEEEDDRKNISKKLGNPNHNLFLRFSTIEQWCFFIPKFKRLSFSSHLTQFTSRKLFTVFQVFRI